PVPWVATGYVAGPSLQQVVGHDHGALPERSVRILAAGLAHALQDIHAAGIVHRDLKPSNVLVTIDGPRVIDFGIARALETLAGDGLTRTGSLVGSPGFMAPEQVRGDRVTPACDVFCLGSVLAYAATGVMPFGGAGSGAHALMFRIAQEEPDLERVPEGIADLVRDCLRKDPAARPPLTRVLEWTGAEDTVAEGRSRDPWLPGALVAQLGRHAVRLLETEDPQGGSDTGTSRGSGIAGGSALGALGAAAAGGVRGPGSAVPGARAGWAAPGAGGAGAPVEGAGASPGAGGPAGGGASGGSGARAGSGAPGVGGAPVGSGASGAGGPGGARVPVEGEGAPSGPGGPAGGGGPGAGGAGGPVGSPAPVWPGAPAGSGTSGVGDAPGASGAGGPGGARVPVEGAGVSSGADPEGVTASVGSGGPDDPVDEAGPADPAGAPGVSGPGGARAAGHGGKGTSGPLDKGAVPSAGAGAGAGSTLASPTAGARPDGAGAVAVPADRGVGAHPAGPGAGIGGVLGGAGVSGGQTAGSGVSPEHGLVADGAPRPADRSDGGGAAAGHLPDAPAGQASPAGASQTPPGHGAPDPYGPPAPYGHGYPQQAQQHPQPASAGYGHPQPPSAGYGYPQQPYPPYGGLGATPPHGPQPFAGQPEPARPGGRSTALLVVVALVVALGAGGSVYALMRHGGDRAAPAPAGSTSTPGASRAPAPADSAPPSGTASPTAADGAVPAAYLGTWKTAIDNTGGANTRRLTIAQGDVGDTVLTLVADGPVEGGGTYHCVFEATLAEQPHGEGPLEIGPSTVTSGDPMSSCSPGEATEVTLLPDGRLKRAKAGGGESLTYTRQ
ncbi:protein kinase, partial [Streptomyces sp. NPDC013313]|uniref:protein kinase domain-containing protein n=1 Tax=Streptomyces sp. NPDC013313 TaxID=3155603 RepID=UPI0033F3B102